MQDFPSLLLAAVVWAYWGRVASMAWHIRRRTHALVGIVPEEGIERLLGLLFVPVVVAWMALPLIAAFREAGAFAIPAAARSGPWLVVRGLAALVAVVLLLATIRCWKRMGRQWKMAVTSSERQDLITDGPFARVRHPIYGYQILLMLASLVVVPTSAQLALALVHLALMTVKARNEERHLMGTHGPDYESYMQRTGRFFPKLSR